MWHHGHGWLWPGTPFLHTPSWGQFHSSPWCSRKETTALRTWASPGLGSQRSGSQPQARPGSRLDTPLLYWETGPVLGNSPGIRNTGQDGSLRPHQRRWGWKVLGTVITSVGTVRATRSDISVTQGSTSWVSSCTFLMKQPTLLLKVSPCQPLPLFRQT